MKLLERPRILTHRLALAPAIVVMTSALVVSCRSTSRVQRPLPDPKFGVSVSHFRGTALSGPLAATQKSGQPKASAPVAVRFVLTGFESAPRSSLPPLGTSAQFVLSPRDGEPLRATTMLTTDWRLGTANDAAQLATLAEQIDGGRRRVLATAWAALLPDITAQLLVDDDADADNHRLSLRVHRRKDDHYHLSIGIFGVRGEVRTEEIVRLTPGMQRHFCFVGPSPFKTAWPVALSFTIDVIDESSLPPEGEVAFRRARTALANDLTRGAAVSRIAGQTANPIAFTQAIDALRWRARRKAAFRYLCQATGAEIANDLVNVFDRERLRQYTERLQAAAGDGTAITDAAALGWLLERIALDLVLAIVAEDDEAVPATHIGILARHIGVVTRDAGTLQTLLRLGKSLADFERRVVIENRYGLEDVSPSARIRAFDWLSARGRAPKDYDPLGPARARRQALDRAEMAAEKSGDEGHR